MSSDIWNYRPQSLPAGEVDLVGFKVEATDGHLGHVTEATHEVDSSYLVIDTGPWILGSRVLLPAGIVTRVDEQARVVHVDRSKDEIRIAPPYHSDTTPGDIAYLKQVRDHYQQQG
ncbi:PRC-barrel domain-containing protein [Streptacidiphilus sp. EB129]|uniref:PRC-barrel domain-containing protein n=1 Tax=Streptacidiphilus sp. EB129 TaxID=3156262 RepID=UPI003513099E